jgi:hypothetical protein
MRLTVNEASPTPASQMCLLGKAQKYRHKFDVLTDTEYIKLHLTLQ